MNTSKPYRNYVLLLLMVVYVFNIIDRQILVILQESIKTDLDLSDKQLGLLSGFSFAIFYVVCGIPIARWADRYSRVNIISASLVVWSGMTALCGLAGNFLHLLAARIGVGVGEAGASPPSHSIISDYFPHELRGRALSVHSAGVSIGILIGFLLGGWINQYFGWRMAFFVVGVPGILLAVLVKLTIREPVRGYWDEGDHSKPIEGSLLENVRRMMSLRSFRYAALGGAFTMFLAHGSLSFIASFAIRVHQTPVSEVGTWLALIVGSGTAIGMLSGGFLSDRMAKRDVRWPYWISGICALAAGVLMFPAMLSEQASAVWVFYFFMVIFYNAYLAPTIATVHALVDPRSRALASALLYFAFNIIGLGLGPLTVGIISDALAPSMGNDSLRWAMLSTSLAAFIGSGMYFYAARLLPQDFANRQKAAY
jgi:predicted MFS family arabinose efflux permease